MSFRPNTNTERFVSTILLLLLVLPLLLSTSQEAYAQRRRKEGSRREAPRRPDPAKSVTPTPPVDDEPFADLASAVLQDLSAPTGVVKRMAFQPDTLLTQRQVSLIARYNREASRIPPRPYASVADHIVNPRPVYAEGNVGLFTTAALRAGVTGRSWPYDYTVGLALERSNGSADNATRSNLSIDASGGYVINDNAWIFSGGYMGAQVSYANRSNALYALLSHPDRSVETWSVSMNGSNTYLSDEFTVQARYRGLTLDDDDAGSLRENALEGSASFGTPWMGLIIGGDAFVSLASLNGESMPFMRFAGGVTYRRSVVTLSAGGAVSTGENDDGSTVTRLVPTGRIAITPSDGFSISADITGGVQQWRGDQVLTANPWAIVMATPNARHEDQMIGYRGEVRLDPSDAVNFHVAASHSPFADYLGYTTPTTGRFIPLYQPTTLDQIVGEAMVRFDANNLSTLAVRFADATLESTGGRLPYTPRWFVEAIHSAQIAPSPLTIILGARFLGDRIDGAGGTMDQVLLLSLEGRYRLNSLLELTGALTNLLDTEYELWTGYQERRFYAAIGLALRY